ncbi:L,D-transpeptidase family protein [Sphingopyxis chilensis]
MRCCPWYRSPKRPHAAHRFWAPAQALKPGEYLWAPEVAPRGLLLLIVSIATRRATLYRNGIPIAITTVSTGRPDHRTPTGVFTILQRKVEHYSSIYDIAPTSTLNSSDLRSARGLG